MMSRLLVFLLLTISPAAFAAAAPANDGGYLFVTFRDEQGAMGEQVYFALSRDGIRWTALNDGKPVLVSELGDKGARDPYLLRAEDGRFFLIATDLSIFHTRNWKRAVEEGSRSLLIWESGDLVSWSGPRLVEVAPPDAGCAWAPEVIFDTASQRYLVYWASTTKRDNFEKHRIWAAWTKDFRTFSEPFIYIEKPTAIIDTDIVRGDDGKFYRFTKDEKHKAMTMEVSDGGVTGEWRDVPGFSLAQMKGYEGPACYQLAPAADGRPATWCLLLDAYATRGGYKAFVTSDLASGNFTPGADFEFPFRFRHGSVLPVSNEEYQRLASAFSMTAAEWFVAPDGDDSAAGTLAKPFATVQRAQQSASPGDTVYLRGGTYKMQESQIAQFTGIFANITVLDKSGEEGKPITYTAYRDEKPVFDCSAVKPDGHRVNAFFIPGSWLRLRGIAVTGVQVTITGHTQSICFEVQGSDNILERLSMHDGQAIGVYLSRRASRNLVLNCDAWNNWDYTSQGGRGGNVDGFGCHGSGEGNVFRGCRAWYNSDDGFDCINMAQPVVFENCWAFYNGFNKNGDSLGDGNGFKAGGYGVAKSNVPDPVPRNTVRNCIAVGNKVSGFYANHHPGGGDWFNNSAYANKRANYNFLGYKPDSDKDKRGVSLPGTGHVIRNNLSHGTTPDKAVIQLAETGNQIDHNAFPPEMVLSDSDFESLDETQLIAPRQPGGGLPKLTFLKPKRGSPLLNAGVDVGLPFSGAAPDIGAISREPGAGDSAHSKTAAREKSFRQVALDSLQITPIDPVRITRRGGVVFADFGKAAYARLQIEFADDPPAGEITVRLGEKLADGGEIDRKPPGSVNICETTLQTRPGRRAYEVEIPMKKFHLRAEPVKMPGRIGNVTPFRCAEIESGVPALASVLAPGKITLRQLAVHAPFDEDAAAFECSDPVLNAVWDLCKHTMKATTAFGVYIDGERERIPYEADAYINMLSHYACDLDPRVARATFEHLLEHPTWPTEWSLQMPMIAFADYEATGDPVLAATHYDALKKKLFPGKARADGLLRIAAIVDWPGGERDGYNDGILDAGDRRQVGPDVNTAANAFYYEALRSMEKLARAIGRQDEAAQMAARADQVCQSFNAVFFDTARGVYTDGEGAAHASLHANMFPLAFGLVPAERRDSVVHFVKSRGMACSVYGAQFLLDALYRNNEGGAALALMTAKTKRSWWHMLELGSTITLEAWDAEFKPNLTWNHAWGAAPANAVARHVLGVRPLQPGGARILVAPQPASLEWMRGRVPTARGPVEVSWENGYADGGAAAGRTHAILQITVPQGASARVELPVAADSFETLFLDGAPITAKIEGNKPVVEHLAPGRHELKLTFASKN